jgi:RNA polymerase sigma factor (sigma-70 family)
MSRNAVSETDTMALSDPDSSARPSFRMPAEPDRFLLRRYHAAMARGDKREAAAAWEQLAINNYDRIKQTVKAFHYSAGSRGIPDYDQGSAISEAFLRIRAMGANFRKQEIEAFYAALRQTVEHACRDYGRKDFRHERRSGGSLDQRYDSESETGPYSGALAAWEAGRRDRAAEVVADELGRQRAEQLVSWGIGQIKNDNYREVLELTYNDHLEAEEIAERLGISMDNVYARRSRGVRELGKVLRDHGS